MAVQTLDKKGDDRLKDEGQKDGEDELGDSVLYEVGEVEFPALLDVSEESLVLGDGGSEVWGWSRDQHEGVVPSSFAINRIPERRGREMRRSISEDVGGGCGKRGLL